MAHAVRRDIHKMKTHMRFREVTDPARPGDPLLVAWCEPAHHVVDAVAPWFARRFPQARWVLLTPDRSAYWDRKLLRYAADGGGDALVSTATDREWLARRESLFQDGDQAPSAGHAAA
jgi:DNA polymerase